MGRKVRVLLLTALVCFGGMLWLRESVFEGERFQAANAEEMGVGRMSSEEADVEQLSTGCSETDEFREGGMYAGEGNTEMEEEAYRELKQIALTFDDGPDAVWTEKLLDGLKERGVKVTFFVIGEKIEGNEDLLKRMYEEGHLIGNHSYHHVELNRLRESTVLEEIERTNELIYGATGYRPEFIRPPYGSWNRKVDCPGEMISVYWTVDTLDWQIQDEDSVVKKILTQAKDGDIILLHDIFESSVDGALEAIDRLIEAGYELVTVDQLMFDS